MSRLTSPIRSVAERSAALRDICFCAGSSAKVTAVDGGISLLRQKSPRPAGIGRCRNFLLPAAFTYGKSAAAAVLYSHTSFPLLGFVFQYIARHLLYTPERYNSVGKLRNFPTLLSHVYPAALSFDGYRSYPCAAQGSE